MARQGHLPVCSTLYACCDRARNTFDEFDCSSARAHRDRFFFCSVVVDSKRCAQSLFVMHSVSAGGSRRRFVRVMPHMPHNGNRCRVYLMQSTRLSVIYNLRHAGCTHSPAACNTQWHQAHACIVLRPRGDTEPVYRSMCVPAALYRRHGKRRVLDKQSASSSHHGSSVQ